VFRLDAPNMEKGPLRKGKKSSSTTNLDRSEDGEELEGILWFLIRPSLKKWGDGVGENLNEATILYKAYMQLAPNAKSG
jgi:hypothetical protein